MRETSFILPLTDNDGNGLAHVHAEVQEELLNAFGGFTMEDVQGVWRNDEGRRFVDASKRYTVAFDDDPSRDNDYRFSLIAAQAGKRAKQECIYVRWSNGTVELI